MCTCLPGAVHWPTGIGMDVIANICSAVVAMNVTWESATASRTMLCSLLERSYGTVSWWGIWTVSHLYSKDKHPIRRVACRLLLVALLGIQEVTHMCACVCARACVLMCCVFVCLCHVLWNDGIISTALRYTSPNNFVRWIIIAMTWLLREPDVFQVTVRPTSTCY